MIDLPAKLPYNPATYYSKANIIKQTYSYPSMVGLIDSQNYYHHLKVHNDVRELYYASVLTSEDFNVVKDKTAFEYFKIHLADFQKMISIKNTTAFIPEDNSIESLKANRFPTGFRVLDGKGGYAIIERPPFKLSLDFSPFKAYYVSSRRRSKKKAEENIRKSFENVSIWVPWTVYILEFLSKSQIVCSVFFNDRPLTSLDDIVFPAILPNVFADGRICFGDYDSHIHQSYTKMAKDKIVVRDIFNECVSYFYSGGFNSDIIPHTCPPFLSMYKDGNSMKRIRDKRSLEIYKTAYDKTEFLNVNSFNKSNYAYGAAQNYANSISIWSNYTLEETMYLFSTYYTDMRDRYEQVENGTSSVSEEAVRAEGKKLSYLTNYKDLAFDQRNNFSVNLNSLFSNTSYGINDATSTYRHKSVYFNIPNDTFYESEIYYQNPMDNLVYSNNTVFSPEYLHKTLCYIINDRANREFLSRVPVPQEYQSEEPF